MKNGKRQSEGERPGWGWLGVGCAALSAMLSAAVGGGVWLVGHPPGPSCTLPALPFSNVSSFAWSLDSKRLLVRHTIDEVAVVRFPDLSVERFPPPGGRIVRMVWDWKGRLLVVAYRDREWRTLRWVPETRSWETLKLAAGVPFPSPDGRWVMVTARERPRQSRSHSIWCEDLVRKQRHRATFSRKLTTDSALWLAPHEARGQLSANVFEERGSWSYDARTGKLRQAKDFRYLVGWPNIHLRVDFNDAPWEETRVLLRKWGVPGVPPRGPWDAVFHYQTAAGKRAIDLGRASEQQIYPDSGISPDGQWWVVQDGSGVPRVVALK